MISDEIKKQYLPTIGIECHVQLNTKTKLFMAESNDSRGAEPNTTVGHISFGMPGALPVLNEKAVEYAVRASFAFNVEPQKYSFFERKHYFYPDLPKGYQISQLAKPIVVGGEVEIIVNGKTKKVRINRVQIEEDAGKSTHPAGKDYSLVDLNRAGTPLLEIVSEADMHSAAEARAYVRELYLLMKYADISDVDLYHGNMRFDVNVSVSKDPNKLGTRSETKNLNSFKAVERAVDFEISRQIERLEKGEEIVQETRGWDDAKQKTVSQRTKEEAHDYRYMPEPDVPPIELSDDFINKVRSEMPVEVGEIRSSLRELKLDESQIEIIIEEPAVANFFVNLKGGEKQLKTIANWLTGPVIKLIADDRLTWPEVLAAKEQLLKLSQMLIENKLSSTAAKELLTEVIKDRSNPEEVAKTKNLLQVSDENAVEKIVAEVLAENEKAAQDVKNGQMKVIGFLVGQVMAKSKGQANPALAQQIIKKQLGV